MVNNNEQHFREVITKYRELMNRSKDAVGTIAVELFAESFSLHGQIMSNGSVKAWKGRGFSPKNRNGAALLVKTGKLQRDLRYRKSVKAVNIISDLPYSVIQNDGGTIPVSAKMRSFFWYMFKKTKDEFWMRMALSKQITIPARPFIYDTPELPARLDKYFVKAINQLIH